MIVVRTPSSSNHRSPDAGKVDRRLASKHQAVTLPPYSQVPWLRCTICRPLDLPLVSGVVPSESSRQEFLPNLVILKNTHAEIRIASPSANTLTAHTALHPCRPVFGRIFMRDGSSYAACRWVSLSFFIMRQGEVVLSPGLARGLDRHPPTVIATRTKLSAFNLQNKILRNQRAHKPAMTTWQRGDLACNLFGFTISIAVTGAHYYPASTTGQQQAHKPTLRTGPLSSPLMSGTQEPINH